MGMITVFCDFWNLRIILRSPHTVPGEPTNPTLTQLTTTTFRVSWGAPTAGGTVTGYRVIYNVDDNIGSVVEDSITFGATQLEWALTLNKDLSYAISIDVQSLSQFFSSSKVAMVIPQGKNLYNIVRLCSQLLLMSESMQLCLSYFTGLT